MELLVFSMLRASRLIVMSTLEIHSSSGSCGFRPWSIIRLLSCILFSAPLFRIHASEIDVIVLFF